MRQMSYICGQMSIMGKSVENSSAMRAEELAAIYLRKESSKKSAAKGAGFDFVRFFSDKMKIIEAIRSGIPHPLFEVLAGYVPLQEADWVEVLGVSSKTLQRYKASGHHVFNSIHSEKIIEMAEVTFMGIEVFGDVEKFKLWLNTPSYALGSYKPKELLISSYGKEMVLGELTRLHYGIFV